MREIKISQPIVLTVLLLVVSSSAQTQGQMNDEACRKYQQADAEMSRVYKQVVAEYKSETAFIKKLGIAQRAWLAFRDAHLEALFPEIDKTRYGSVYPMCRCDVLAELSRERTKMLKKWTAGNKEGDVCTGSVKISVD
ncbi:MAG TPA: lysozyme inhibitor LprI family protein [Blastocatellia bacterium]|nr:lysozyme inhibitor LprI family protein [Blastocatellia bacterium]